MGYTFAGWTQSDNPESLIIGDPFKPNSNVTLYARGITNKYIISFNTNEGIEIELIAQDYNILITKLDDPTKIVLVKY